MKQFVTAREAAMELGLSSSTFKRLCDTHCIPLIRTPGGHRRIDRKHLSLAVHVLKSKSCQTTLPDINVGSLVDLLKNGDSESLKELLLATAGTPQRIVAILEDYFVPAMWMVGDLYFTGKVEVAEEKLCTSTACRVLDAIAMWMPRVETSRTFVGATFQQNTDTISSKLVSIGLATIGVKAIDLGPGLSPELIARAAVLCGADSIWISHTHVASQHSFLENHIGLRSALPHGFRVIIGGGGLSPSLRRQVPDCIYYESISLMLKGEALPLCLGN